MNLKMTINMIFFICYPILDFIAYATELNKHELSAGMILLIIIIPLLSGVWSFEIEFISNFPF